MSFTKKDYFAPAPATSRGHAVRLSTDPKGERFVYANGKTVVIRSLDNLEESWEYTGHTQQTTMARFSPSGFFVASGDVMGNVRIWDAMNEEHRLKSEFRPISGRINDIAWDHESQRVMAVGEGKDRFGHVFMYDSGNSVGVIDGHSKPINACSMRQQRPFRAATTSDDGSCVFYTGAPYRFSKTLKEHTGFVHDVKYSPSDEFFATVGADKKIFLYDGRTGDLVRQVAAIESAEAGHKGSIFAVSWSPDSKYLVTSSGDRTCKFWDVVADKLVHTVLIGSGSSAPEHQQIGNLWAGSRIISLSLSGDLNVLSMDSEKPVRVVVGHQKPITAAVMTPAKTLFTGSYDGKLCMWDFASQPGVASVVAGSTGDARLDTAASSNSGFVALGYMDDTLRFAEKDSISSASAIGLGAATLSLDIDGSGTTTIAALANDDLVVVSRGTVAKVTLADAKAAPSAVAIDKSSSLVAIGFKDNTVRTYALKDGNLEPAGAELGGHTREITYLAFSPDGSLLASGDAGGKIVVSDAKATGQPAKRWSAHTARIYCISWAPDGTHAASSSLDGHVMVWSTERPTKPIQIRNAHLGGSSSVSFMSNDTVVSTGADGGVKVWTVSF
ncbi:WD40 repeat-like protein [Coemansia asiatica]|uniref:WD40 repeat-like protein n=1 Tax=Coemansia asiatica TaxID=1052880 RepID=A0A9W7XQE0_9FUNG|nr:WD40 repeat-like protein [Coemansia asiatica]